MIFSASARADDYTIGNETDLRNRLAGANTGTLTLNNDIALTGTMGQISVGTGTKTLNGDGSATVMSAVASDLIATATGSTHTIHNPDGTITITPDGYFASDGANDSDHFGSALNAGAGWLSGNTSTVGAAINTLLYNAGATFTGKKSPAPAFLATR